MPSLAIARVMLRELLTFSQVPREPEPDLVMDDPDKVAAYTRAGRVDGVMAPVYLFHGANILEILKPGDRAIDLACGPATQLGLVAELAPEVSFTGIDLSDEMLGIAERYIRDRGYDNVSLTTGDISRLEFLEDHSVDAVFSTMALHHLPDPAHLDATFREIHRVLKPGGGIYLADFARLRSPDSIRYFAYQYADRQPELFTLDYLYSLKAAFSVADFRTAAAHLAGQARLHAPRIMPFMLAVKSPPRTNEHARLRPPLAAIAAALPDNHKTDLKDLRTIFGLAGMKCGLL
ncbi:class I SAM-dependent methyltransferase [Thiohalobacter thiocyanaticus]|uniref:Class I SAM-dependent methyltransferase n=1 Tax=Thiohalobacter thiocyanaticus TaxID=585455 RepID=A0A426QM71_9GAMM|nr:class I SAM-dependent methyltransferase [Thiohalobacter thiocyanaticus]RRQ22817.1 class I SAM-dependent methyltransferase [Thiohalobacter thiocyanaticus]